MIISCPKCPAKYIVPLQEIGEARKVRCAKCQHVWLQKNKEEDIDRFNDIKKEITNIQSNVSENKNIVKDKITNSNVPAIIPKKSYFMANFTIFTMVFIVLGAFLLLANSEKIMNNYEIAEKYYEKLEIYNFDQVILYSDNIKVKDNKNNKDIVVSGMIKNESDVTRKVPKLQIKIYDKNNHLIRKIEFSNSHYLLRPNEEYDFVKKINSLPKNVTRVIVSIGNKIDFLLRG